MHLPLSQSCDLHVVSFVVYKYNYPESGMALAIPAVLAPTDLTEMFLATHSFSVSFKTNGSPCSHEHFNH